MIINRQNYQIWITDYYDGRLDDFQAEVLMDFLSDNPDLKPEFEDYPGLSVSPGMHNGPDKSKLLRTPDELTNEQLEHFSIAFCENDLDEKQKGEIEGLGKTYPRFRKNIAIYEKIKLKPDQSQYPGKLMLLKIPGRRRRTGILVTSFSIAASIAILAGLFLIFNQQSPAPSIDRQVIASVTEDEAEEIIREKPPLPDLTDKNPPYTNAGAETASRQAPVNKEISKNHTIPGQQETLHVKRETQVAISKIPIREEIKLDHKQVHYLLAETEPYEIKLPGEKKDSLKMSVREFLAFHFRKTILDKEDPGVDHLKAWEIADAGIKGVNTLLGWNMEFQTGQSEDGKLQNLRFTSELIKVDHKFKKSNPDL